MPQIDASSRARTSAYALRAARVFIPSPFEGSFEYAVISYRCRAFSHARGSSKLDARCRGATTRRRAARLLQARVQRSPARHRVFTGLSAVADVSFTTSDVLRAMRKRVRPKAPEQASA